MLEAEYDEMVNIINKNGLFTENLYYKAKKHHPITYADVDEVNGNFEIVLTYRDDIGSCQSLDYIFALKLNYDQILLNCSISDNNKSIENGIVYNQYDIRENISNNSQQAHKEKESHLVVERHLDIADVNDTSKPLFVIPDSMRIIKHLINEMNFNEHDRVYTQLSDHFGLSCQIAYKEGNSKDTILIVKDKEDEENINIENKESKAIKNDDEKIEIEENPETQVLLVEKHD